MPCKVLVHPRHGQAGRTGVDGPGRRGVGREEVRRLFANSSTQVTSTFPLVSLLKQYW